MPADRPPLGLSVEVTLSDGSKKRWDSKGPAADRPQGLQFRTRTGDGFSDASVTLARRIDRDYIDLNLLDDVAFIGDDGATAYEGRVMGIPRSFGDAHSVTVNCAGWMAHARDQKFREIYVDRDMGAWGPITPAQRANQIATNARVYSDGQASPDPAGNPALILGFQGPSGVAGGDSQLRYDAGPGCVAQVFYSSFVNGANVNPADANFYWAIGPSGDLQPFGLPLTGYSNVGTQAFAIELGYFTSIGNSNFELWAKTPAVYGNHGLTRRGSDPGGFYASDVITNIAQRFCPKLSTAGVQATTYPIPHLAFKDPTDPYDGFLECNKYHLWDLGVWENKTLTYRPYDLSGYDWEVRLSDLGVTVDLQGDSADDVANGIAVNYTDVATGQSARITPNDDATLTDSSTDNPVNTHGLTKWTELALSSPTTAAAAVQIGRIALAEFNLPKAPGTITVQGHVKDRAGHWQQGWKVRAGDTVAITDHPNDRPRLITETSWDQDSKTLTISVEGPAHRLDAVLDRITTSLTAANLV